MYTRYHSFLRANNINVSYWRFFSSVVRPTDNTLNPKVLFRLYDPGFSAPHFLPLEIGSNNTVFDWKKIFSWPQALMKSICPEARNIENDEKIKQKLKENEEMALPIEPLKKATHLMKLANFHLSLLNADKSEELLDSAIKILCTLDSLESEKIASDAYLRLAITKQLKEEYTIAIKYYEEALKYSVNVFGGFDHPSQARLYAMLGMAYATVNKEADFEKCYQQIIQIMQTCFTDSPHTWVDFTSDLAIIFQIEGKYSKSIELHKQCCQIYNEYQKEKISNCVEKNNLAATLIADNDILQAKKYLEEAKNELEQSSINPDFLKIIKYNLEICARHKNLNAQQQLEKALSAPGFLIFSK